ncbi:DNA replication complex GINS protein PSF2, partial [Gonapodya prolifera JEL478]
MALPKSYRQHLSPAELDFLACCEFVSITPLERVDQVKLISASYGPFRPPVKADIPLWLALSLRKRRKAQINPPKWMDPENLQKKFEEEVANDQFSLLPFHTFGVAKALLDNCQEDIRSTGWDPDQIRTLLKDIRERRQHKARQGLGVLDGKYLQLDNITLQELNEIRPFFSRANAMLARLNADDEN